VEIFPKVLQAFEANYVINFFPPKNTIMAFLEKHQFSDEKHVKFNVTNDLT